MRGKKDFRLFNGNQQSIGERASEDTEDVYIVDNTELGESSFIEDAGWVKIGSGKFRSQQSHLVDDSESVESTSSAKGRRLHKRISWPWDFTRDATLDSSNRNNLAILPVGCRRTNNMAFVHHLPRGGGVGDQGGGQGGDTDLLMFTGDNCDHCDQMEPYLKRLEKELGVRVHRFNVWKDQVNFKLFEKLDEGQKCGGLPYFYNTRTKQCVCGATTFGNLRAWAKGKPCNMFYYVPEKGKEEGEGQEGDGTGVGGGRRRKVGLLGRFSSKIGELKEEGVGKVKERVEEESRKRKGTDKLVKEKEVEPEEKKKEMVKN
ncbi:hypothetical protein TrCOL_g6205 [Triparma columacea]|uniref:Thioredoxin domain-containing protein n=1 Tax=Triparma columacea TaxID=722753 RepID=A0A9W7LFX5_9STRA|nr:hypothetical protein TrCOL_g6205 [Triparma columacea]